jgi:hypothetical protein
MKNFKAAANSCKTSSTRKLSIELDGNDLRIAFTVALLKAGVDAGTTLALWPQFWSTLKHTPSYTVRVNGRVTIKKGKVVSKTTRKKLANLERLNETSTKLLALGKTLAALGAARKAAA